MEIIVVFTVLAIILGIASFGIFRFINKGQSTAYNIAENTLQDAASAAFSDCITGTTNNFCSKYNLPQNKYDYELVYLDDLIESEYVDPIKDPNDS
ncbi:MAG: type II secretion system protein, partial [Firmicutes bacterium]|nr:type II secretion system protein [Bacillota bacterium]